MNVKIRLDIACVELKKAMQNAEAVRRYEEGISLQVHGGWNEHYLNNKVAQARYRKLYRDIVKSV
jgi:hypothetical protein